MKKPLYVRYAHGKRPKLPAYLRHGCPEIAALIEEMWLTDFRARPAMKDVVARLEACTTIDCEVGAEAPQVEDVADAASTEEQSELEAIVGAQQLEIEELKARSRAVEDEAAELRAEVAALKGVAAER